MFHSVFVLIGLSAAGLAISLAFLSQRYWFARAWRFAGKAKSAGWRRAIRAALVALVVGVAVAAVALLLRNARGAVSRGSWWMAFLGFWLSSSVISYLFIKSVSIIEWVWRRLQRGSPAARKGESPDVPLAPAMTATDAAAEQIDHSRRHFFQAAGVIAGVIPFASAAYGFIEERFHFRIREVEIPVVSLPAALDGLRITQLSDIHIGAYMPARQVRRAVGMANELKGDLTVVTGDFLTTRGDPLEDCIAELAKLHAPMGVWGCNGNHEIYARAEAKSAELFRRYGMKLLRRENAELHWNGAALNLIGVDYQRQRDPDGNPARMLVGLEPLVRRDVPNILLSHNPNSFPRAAEMGIELSLAGHTHGGQVRVEILDREWSPAEFLTPYVAGMYSRPLLSAASLNDDELRIVRPASNPEPPASRIYVNRGLGTIGAPVRLGVPPEITLITLRRAV